MLEEEGERVLRGVTEGEVEGPLEAVAKLALGESVTENDCVVHPLEEGEGK